jgi:hypothetical protein
VTDDTTSSSDVKGCPATVVVPAGKRHKAVPCPNVTRAVILELHFFRKDFHLAI